MAESLSIHLPLYQRYDCRQCGYCCKDLVVNVTDAEREKIVKAGWQSRIADEPIFIRYRFGGRRLYRLAKRPNGECVFLNDEGLCRLHAETGIGTKPLTCRIYPFTPRPSANGPRLDLRADCPSIAANKGRSLTVHAREIEQLTRESGIPGSSPHPAWHAGRQLSVAEFDSVITAFEGLLRKNSLPVRTRLQAGCYLLDLLYTVRVHKVQDERFVELMELLSTAALEEAQQHTGTLSNTPARKPARLFRQWLFLHAIADDPKYLDTGPVKKLLRSWARYRQARRFAAGTGQVPRLVENWPTTTFETIDQIKPAPDETLEPLCRSLRLKLDSHAFAGINYYNYDMISGLTALWLLPAVVGWFARLSAVSKKRDTLSADDVITGLRRAHHTYGISPVFARVSEKLRLRGLAHIGVPRSLLTKYGP